MFEERRIGIIGLGNVGLPAAINLVREGFEVVGLARSFRPALVEAGGSVTDSIADLASCPVIVQCLPNADALDEIVDAVLSNTHLPVMVVDLSSYPIARKSAAARRYREHGIAMLDCEVSGLPKHVADRSAVIFTSGPAEEVAAARPLFDALATTHFYLGEFGTASRMKVIANAMVCVHNLMAAEALNLGQRAGLDSAMMIRVLGASAAGSATFMNKAPLMVRREFDEGPGPFSHMFGHLARAGDLAIETGAATPLVDATRAIYAIAADEGRDREDIAAAIEIVEDLSAPVETDADRAALSRRFGRDEAYST